HGRLSPIAGRGAGDDAPAADGDDGEAFEASESSPGGRRALGGLLPEFFDLDPRSTVPRAAAPAAVSDVRPAAVTVTVYLVPDVRGGRPPPSPAPCRSSSPTRSAGTAPGGSSGTSWSTPGATPRAAGARRPRRPPRPRASPWWDTPARAGGRSSGATTPGASRSWSATSSASRAGPTSGPTARRTCPRRATSRWVCGRTRGGASWRSLVAIRSEAGHATAPPSRRRYAFNAMFSISTNASRERLSYIVEGNAAAWRARTGMEAYVRMSNWFGDPNERRSDQTTTEEYMRVLLDSVFTVSPAGHNPECFRMYEAVEAGSILITTRDDLVSVPDASREGAPGCPDALALWSDAPMVVLDSWDDLYPEVERRMSDPAGLDAMQRRSAEWYGRMMGGTVGELEDFLLGSFAGEGRGRWSGELRPRATETERGRWLAHEGEPAGEIVQRAGMTKYECPT
ncbi:hypothetical protein THAOC_20008, partial [Thalassiosira oceanica]